MITLRIKSVDGILKCEFSEVEKPNYDYQHQGLLHAAYLEKHKEVLKIFESSFQSITLSEEARGYLNTKYDLYFIHKLLELSGDDTKMFEVEKMVNVQMINDEKLNADLEIIATGKSK